jgi:hypothetical protein
MTKLAGGKVLVAASQKRVELSIFGISVRISPYFHIVFKTAQDCPYHQLF